MSFHKSAYADRIAKVTKSLKVFDWLRDHKPKLKGRETGSAFGIPMRSARGSPSVSGANTPMTPNDFVLDGDNTNSRNASSSSKGTWFKKHSKKRPSDRLHMRAKTTAQSTLPPANLPRVRHRLVAVASPTSLLALQPAADIASAQQLDRPVRLLALP